ncbi:MAG: hypothetical protein ACOX9C_09230 [Kiritimatiellia bacterium]|jgi:serine protease Do
MKTCFSTFLTSCLALAVLASAPAALGDTAEKQAEARRLKAAADRVLAGTVSIAITPKLDGVEEPILAPISEKCPGCGRYHSYGISRVLEYERSIPQTGFLLPDGTVLCRDLLLNPENIASIQVGKGEATAAATLEKVFVEQKAVLLKLAGPLAGATALALAADAGKPEGVVAVQRRLAGRDAELSAAASPALGEARQGEDGATRFPMKEDGALFDAAGRLCGFNFNSTLADDGAFDPAAWSSLDLEALAAVTADAEKAAANSTLPVTVSFRNVKPQRGGASRRRRWMSSDDDASTLTELKTLGTVVSESRIVIHIGDARAAFTRLKRIRVFFPDGTTADAEFLFAHKRANVVVAALPEPRPAQAMRFGSARFADYADHLLTLVRLTPSGAGKSKIRSNRIRLDSLDAGWRDLPDLDVPTKDDEGLQVVDRDGHVLWIAVDIREARQSIGADDRQYSQTMILDAQDFAALADPDPKDIDAAVKPVPDAEDGAIGWIGLDLQPMQKDVAESLNVLSMTEDGSFGGIVVKVHPESSAAKAGVENGWILLSVRPRDAAAPLKVKLEDGDSMFSGRFPWEHYDEIPAEAFDEFIPTPWPSVKNNLTEQLMRMGVGTEIVAEFVVDGKKVSKTLVVESGPKYYATATSYKWDAAGITVCDLTAEVREYLNLADDAPGVVVCKMETKGKAVVAGVKQYEVVTRINGKPVKDVAAFEAIVKDETAFKLDVLRMASPRVVQFRLDAAAPAAEGDADDSADADDEASADEAGELVDAAAALEAF